MGELRVVGDGEAWYLVAESPNDDGEVETVQIARFESERAVRLFERLTAGEAPADV